MVHNEDRPQAQNGTIIINEVDSQDALESILEEKGQDKMNRGRGLNMGKGVDCAKKMALETFRRTTRSLFRTYPTVKDEIDKIKYTILGQFPVEGIKTGYQWNKIQPKFVYRDHKYDGLSILPHARKVRFVGSGKFGYAAIPFSLYLLDFSLHATV